MRLIPWKQDGYIWEFPKAPKTVAQKKYYEYFCSELDNGRMVKINQYTMYILYYLNSCVKEFIESKNFNRLINKTENLLNVYGSPQSNLNKNLHQYISLGLEVLKIQDSALYFLNNQKNLVMNFCLEHRTNENTLGRTLYNIVYFFSFFKTDPQNILKVEDVQLAINIGNYLTDFGIDHFEAMKPIINRELESYRKKHGENLLYSIFKPYLFKDTKTLFVRSTYSQERKVLHCRISPTNDKVAKPLREFFRHCENLYRDSINVPRIGEGWISETLLFKRIKAAFPKLNVIHHGRPDFLKPQHLDIYIPQLRLGIEYQGEQHFKPVSLFGGEEGFQNTKKRDQLKRRKMVEHDHFLIEVMPKYQLDDILKQVIEIANKQGINIKIDYKSLNKHYQIENDINKSTKD